MSKRQRELQTWMACFPLNLLQCLLSFMFTYRQNPLGCPNGILADTTYKKAARAALGFSGKVLSL